MATEFYNRNWRMPNSWNGSTDNNSKVSNYSMSFDGSSEFIDCGTDIGNYFGEDYTGEMAISIWFKADTTSSDDGIFIFTGSSPLGEISAYIYANDLEVRVRGVVVASGSFTDTSNWHNLIINLFGPSGANQVYLDGVAFSSTFTYTSGGLDFNGETFEIGHYGGTRYFSGKLDHCCIFDYALSAQQISDLQGNSTDGVGNPMAITGGRKPIAYYPIGDYAAFNGSEYLVNNGALQDYNLKINPANLNQGFVVSEDYGYSAFTISMWVNQDFVGRTIWVNEDTTGANTEKISISINANSFLVFNCQGGGDSYTLSTQHNLTGDDRLFGTNRWINITAVYTGTDMILYGNANSGNFVSVSASNYPAGGTVPSSITLAQNQTIIGKANLAGLSEFRGQLSNFSVFDAALPETGSESATSLFNNGTPVNISSYSNLQGWWQFNAGSTFDAVAGIWTSPDSSSNNNSAVGNFPNSFEKMQASYLVQSNLLITQPYSRYALSFDGTSDYVDVGNPTELQLTTNISISVWFKIDSNPTNTYLNIITKWISGDAAWSAYVTNSTGKLSFWISTNGSTQKQIHSSTNVNDNQWHHFVGTNDGVNNKIYIDGVLEDTGTSGNIYNSTQNILIGKTNQNSFLFEGLIDEVSIWDSALSSDAITEIYNQGKPSNLNNHSAYSNLVSWWQLGENSSFDGTNWTVLDEKGTNNGTSSNMGEDAIVNGVGTSGNGISDGMGGADNIIGDAPYSTANAVSYGMGVDAKSTDVPS
jgi:hypothetical protein